MHALNQTDIPPRFVAWTRTPPSRTWVKVAEASTEWEARDAVYAVAPTGVFRDVCVLPAHRDPNDRGQTR